jgi:hypothetical protein
VPDSFQITTVEARRSRSGNPGESAQPPALRQPPADGDPALSA